MKKIIIIEKTEDEVAAVMIDWLAKKYGIKMETLALAIGFMRKPKNTK